VKRGDGNAAAIQIAIGDLTGEAVDAIVNSSNRGLFGTTGVDGAIHRRGGRRLTDATRAIGGIDYGEAVFTLGFDLPATYVIHTATTPWDASGQAVATLRRCYEATLSVVERLAIKSLAIPAIGTGAYGYPLDEAAGVAVSTIVPWLRGRGRADVVRFVVGDRATAAAYRRHLDGIS
jgi:O-acetyl-ADP-ribose deacetylase